MSKVVKCLLKYSSGVVEIVILNYAGGAVGCMSTLGTAGGEKVH